MSFYFANACIAISNWYFTPAYKACYAQKSRRRKRQLLCANRSLPMLRKKNRMNFCVHKKEFLWWPADSLHARARKMLLLQPTSRRDLSSSPLPTSSRVSFCVREAHAGVRSWHRESFLATIPGCSSETCKRLPAVLLFSSSTPTSCTPASSAESEADSS